MNVAHLTYKGDSEPIPIAEDLRELGQLVESRVVPGLEELVDIVDIEKVEYAGYALTPYFPPTEGFDFTNPEATQGLLDAMKNAGLEVNIDGPHASEDIRVGRINCFDHIEVAITEGRYDGYMGTEKFLAWFQVLGPVVRLPWEFEETGLFPPRDQYNQELLTVLGLERSIMFTGRVFKRLIEEATGTDLGSTVPQETPWKLLTNLYGLQPVDTTWQDWYSGKYLKKP